jgi:hypothetical protein
MMHLYKALPGSMMRGAVSAKNNWKGCMEKHQESTRLLLLNWQHWKPSSTTVATPVFQKDEVTGLLIESILAKAPQHKRVLFLKAKYDNNEILTVTEVNELKKFEKLLLNK